MTTEPVSVISPEVQIFDPPIIDNSISERRLAQYQTANPNTNLDTGTLTINVNSSDEFRDLHSAYLHFELGIVDSAGQPLKQSDLVAFAHNAIPHMYSQIRLKINDQVIEEINTDPGVITTMNGLAKYSKSFSNSGDGLKMCWGLDTNKYQTFTGYAVDTAPTNQQAGTLSAGCDNLVSNIPFVYQAANIASGMPNMLYSQGYVDRLAIAKGTIWDLGGSNTVNRPSTQIAFDVPLRHLFGFCEFYKKLIWGAKITIELSRITGGDYRALITNKNATTATTATMSTAITFPEGVAPVSNGQFSPKNSCPTTLPCSIKTSNLTLYMNSITPSLSSRVSIQAPIDENMLQMCEYLQCVSTGVPLEAGTNRINKTLSSQSNTQRPRWAIVGFQQVSGIPAGVNGLGTGGRSQSGASNYSVFDNLNVQYLQFQIGSRYFPTINVSTFINENNFARYQQTLNDMRKDLYGITEEDAASCIDNNNWSTLYPIYVFDCRAQGDEAFLTGSENMSIQGTCNSNIPPGTTMYYSLYCDRMIGINKNMTQMV